MNLAVSTSLNEFHVVYKKLLCFKSFYYFSMLFRVQPENVFIYCFGINIMLYKVISLFHQIFRTFSLG